MALVASLALGSDVEGDVEHALVDPRFGALQGALPEEENGSAAWRLRARANAALTEFHREKESRYYTGLDGDSWHPPGLPRRCIAMSGGGYRSMSFNLGVLDALHEIGELDRIDVISSVSGGSMANYWLIENQLAGASREDLFGGEAPSRWVRMTRTHASDIRRLRDPQRAAPGRIFDLDVLIPGAGIVESQLRSNRYHKPVLHDMWAADLAILVRLGNPVGSNLRAAFDPRTVSVRRFLQRHESPLPIFVATAASEGRVGGCGSGGREGELATRLLGLRERVFEMSPLRFGSEGLGYHETHERDVELASMVAASSSATDDPTASLCEVKAALGMRLGMSVPRFRPQAPFADGPQQASLGRRKDIAIVDGAYAENLGVYPLIRRLCQEILIVDAEQDPHLVFESYGYLKAQLARQRITLRVPAVDAIADGNRRDCAQEGACACGDGFCLIEPAERCAAFGGCRLTPTRIARPVVRGTIGPIPYAWQNADGDWEHRDLTLRVRYLKLSLDDSRIATYPANVRARWARQEARRSPGLPVCRGSVLPEDCTFPHEATLDLNFEGEQFASYWELGACIAQRHLPSGATGVSACPDFNWREPEVEAEPPAASGAEVKDAAP